MRRVTEEQNRGHWERRIGWILSWGVIAVSIALLACELGLRWFGEDAPPLWVKLLSVLVGVLAIGGVYLVLAWKNLRIPREVPFWFRLRAAQARLRLDGSILDRIFIKRRPPLFIVGKDQQHIEELQDLDTSLKSTQSLKSLKCASGHDLHRICEVAHVLSGQVRARSGELLPVLRHHALGLTGVPIVERRKRTYKGRSMICAGGGDTNPVSADIVRRYSRFWGGFPPLRFTLSTSEVILARTARSFQTFWENENAEQEMDRTGLIFACDEPRLLPVRLWHAVSEFTRRKILGARPNWSQRAIWLILAGLHREGTQASCKVFELMVSHGLDYETYRFSRNLILPYAITRLGPQAAGGNAVPQLVLQPTGNWTVGFNGRDPEDLQINANLPDGAVAMNIVIGRAHRDYQDQAERRRHDPLIKHVQLTEASRVVDLVVRYTLSHVASIKTTDDLEWSEGGRDEDQVKAFLSGADETVLLGTEDQNRYVQRLIDLPEADVGQLKDNLAALRADIGAITTPSNPVGGFLATELPCAPGRKIVIVLGIGTPEGTCSANGKPLYDRKDRTTNLAARATQTALVGLLKELADTASGRLQRVSDLADGRYLYRIQNTKSMYPIDDDVERA